MKQPNASTAELKWPQVWCAPVDRSECCCRRWRSHGASAGTECDRWGSRAATWVSPCSWESDAGSASEISRTASESWAHTSPHAHKSVSKYNSQMHTVVSRSQIFNILSSSPCGLSMDVLSAQEYFILVFLNSMISQCQTYVNRCNIGHDCLELHFQSAGNEFRQTRRAPLWSTDELAHMIWPKNMRHLVPVRMLLVSGGHSVGWRTTLLELPAHQRT